MGWLEHERVRVEEEEKDGDGGGGGARTYLVRLLIMATADGSCSQDSKSRQVWIPHTQPCGSLKTLNVL